MASTNENLKDFFALSGNNPTLTDAQLIKIRDWLDFAIGPKDEDGNSRTSTSDDLVDWLYQIVKSNTIKYSKQQTPITF